jgi:hypothetical protein
LLEAGLLLGGVDLPDGVSVFLAMRKTLER